MVDTEGQGWHHGQGQEQGAFRVGGCAFLFLDGLRWPRMRDKGRTLTLTIHPERSCGNDHLSKALWRNWGILEGSITPTGAGDGTGGRDQMRRRLGEGAGQRQARSTGFSLMGGDPDSPPRTRQDALHGLIEGRARIYYAASMLIWVAFGIPPTMGQRPLLISSLPG